MFLCLYTNTHSPTFYHFPVCEVLNNGFMIMDILFSVSKISETLSQLFNLKT